MSPKIRVDTLARPAMLLVAGRAIGLVASFAIGIILARMFAPATFGTYKQFFLVYMTLYGLAQLGMAESLYYFVPKNAARTGRYVCNALIMLAGAGLMCTVGLWLARTQIAARLSNPELADYMLLLGLFLTFMLMSTVLEIIMVSRKQHFIAAFTYAISDIVRTLLFIIPALMFGSLRAVFIGATLFAGGRLALMVASLWREFGREFTVDVALWRHQLAYALPFALAVGIEVIQINYHQYVVASRFDAATFAIYAIGCLQIPLVDLIVTSTVNVLMVKMAEDSSDPHATVGLWHDTVERLAFLIVPLALMLVVVAHGLIVGLFTETYAASVPIFMVWALGILPSVFAVDAVLRSLAQTRFLLFMNVLRLGLVALLIGWCLSTFGLAGAVLVTLLTTTLVKGMAVWKIARLLHIPLRQAMPWGRLGAITAKAAAATVPVLWINHALHLTPLIELFAGGTAYVATYAALSFGHLLDLTGARVLGSSNAQVQVHEA
jgi:O-antigen/teichoic acid export membrane protein